MYKDFLIKITKFLIIYHTAAFLSLSADYLADKGFILCLYLEDIES